VADRSSPARSSAVLWSSLFAPGLVCVALGVFVVESRLLAGVGIVLLLAPLAMQLFGPDWSREHIPEGHSHDHHDHHEGAHGHEDVPGWLGEDVGGGADARGRVEVEGGEVPRG
jgi:hypothetical protein